MRLILGVAIPLLVGYYAYSQASAPAEAPLELRAVHPAPPDTISFRGKEINLQHADTPVRKDIKQNPANRAKHLAAGAALYIRNCVYCHGDLLDGQGHFASGFNPQPADFVGPNTIAQLAEGYVFWRIAKGGPGLPKESTPWNSAMPAWEDRLTEEQIWQVVYYLYETTGHPPGSWDRTRRGRPSRARPPGLLAAERDRLGPRPAAAQSGDVALGKAVYEKRCAGCHGAGRQGRRAGGRAAPAAPARLHRREVQDPHDGRALASDQDLLRIVTDGMPGTSMPPWRALPERERAAVVAYVKTFAEAYKGAKLEPVAVPKEVASSEASIRRGKKMFDAFECVKCHGQAGRGDPAPGSDLKDDWGHPIRPANLHKPWTFRGRLGAEGRGHAAPDRGGRDADARDRRLRRGLPEVRREGRRRAGREPLGPRQLRPLPRSGPGELGVPAVDHPGDRGGPG